MIRFFKIYKKYFKKISLLKFRSKVIKEGTLLNAFKKKNNFYSYS